MKNNSLISESYAYDLFIQCTNLFALPQFNSADIRFAILNLVKALLRIRVPAKENIQFRPFPINDAEKSFSLEALYRNLMNELKAKSNKSSNVKSDLLKVIGMLIGIYNSEICTVEYAVEQSIKFCFRTLQEMFSGKVDVEFPVLAGIWSCLDYIVGDFEDKIEGELISLQFCGKFISSDKKMFFSSQPIVLSSLDISWIPLGLLWIQKCLDMLLQARHYDS